MVLSNMVKTITINLTLLSPTLNKVILHEMSINEDEVVGFYINLLKCVSVTMGEAFNYATMKYSININKLRYISHSRY
jgi:hypothetical protein